HLPRASYAGGHGRLHRGPEPRAAHFAHRPVFLRSFGARFSKAHHPALLRAAHHCRDRSRRHRARGSGGSGGACPLDRGAPERPALRMAEESTFRIAEVQLDEKSILRRTREIEQERDIAIYDLLEANSFKPEGSAGGPYKLVLGIADGRLVFELRL